MKNSTRTYISLFSSAGVGCYGFKLEGFECIATNELIRRRLDVQKFNDKCKYPSGYICGDITSETTKELLQNEIERWRKFENIDDVDVVIATPPCQGMSVANHKKAGDEIKRNSLVVESIKVIKNIKPRFFVFENVAAFMKTACTDIDGTVKSISDAIHSNLGKQYSIASQIINFKNYGACSSRTRTIVIGVRRELTRNVAPVELFPDFAKERTLRETIGGLLPLNELGEVDPDDIYHAFRPYPEHMRTWVSGLKEGQSAFENTDLNRIPHKIADGKIVYNQQKNGDKYRRQFWDKVGPCIHTRNDQFASQNTIHPVDDRVFSIRELMKMMTIPDDFKWVELPIDTLNGLSVPQKQALLKKEEMKIRQSIGEAVPTDIFRSIAKNIGSFLDKAHLTTSEVNKEIEKFELNDDVNLISHIKKSEKTIGVSSLSRIAEIANTRRTQHAAFFTDKFLVSEIIDNLPMLQKQTVRILEPSVGVGNFIPLLARKYMHIEAVVLDVVDIDPHALEVLKTLISAMRLPANLKINYICADFLLHEFNQSYDLIIGNPPFNKLPPNDDNLKKYRANALNQSTTNTFAFFLEKAITLSSYVALVTPKFLLNTPEFETTRTLLEKRRVDAILDFGESGFKGVLVETIAVLINTAAGPSNTLVHSIAEQKKLIQRQSYIFDKKYPYWIIYRDRSFDDVANKLEFNIFTVFRDRQITNKNLKSHEDIRVLRSRNISDDGTEINDIDGYDVYISKADSEALSVYKYLNRDDVYLTPNMTYKPRVIKKPEGVLVNGSVAILMLKDGERPLSLQEMHYYSTDEYRSFYKTARNYQTRSLNVDANSVFFFGRLKKEVRHMTWLKEKDILSFLNQHNYDIRVSNNARWIDQKCAADVITVVADCIMQFIEEQDDKLFSSMDIWHNEYTVSNVENSFKKPNPDEKKARNEYDKFFQQPMEMMAYAGILEKYKKGTRNFYRVKNRNVLEYLALREKNSLDFLCMYIEKVLKDSGIYEVFDSFFKNQVKQTYENAKNTFTEFTIQNTAINGSTECWRIFIKVMNPLAYKYNSCGTEKGRMSKHKITYDMLMYNRDNFRDIYSEKPKDLTRRQYEEKAGYKPNTNYFAYQSQKAKKFVRKFNDTYRNSKTEVWDERHIHDKAVNIHHIFPEAEYPQICMFYENLIALTPTQHFSYAHLLGNTQTIDPQFQHTCLLAKAGNIKENIENPMQETIYEFRKFLFVLTVGLGDESFENIEDMDFDDVIRQINLYYI